MPRSKEPCKDCRMEEYTCRGQLLKTLDSPILLDRPEGAEMVLTGGQRTVEQTMEALDRCRGLFRNQVASMVPQRKYRTNNQEKQQI